MNLLESLKELGVEVNEGLERVMGDESLYTMMLGMFLASVEENKIALEDFDAAQLDELIKRVHTLKGMTGNLAMTPLFHGYTQSLEFLREGKPAEAKAAFQQFLPTQEKIIACIRQAQ